MRQFDLPKVLVLEPTNHCNMKCNMCPNDRQKNKGYISINLISKIVKEISPSVKYIQTYFVGESTLHPNLLKIIELFKNHTSAKIELSTNLIKLKNKDFAKSILNSGLDILICCIDGMSEYSYNSVRKGTTLQNIVDTTHFLASYKIKNSLKIKIIVKCIETKFNTHEIPFFLNYWNSIEGVEAKITWLNTWAGSINNIESIMVKGCPNAILDRKACAEIWNKIIIRWNGEVVLCCHDWESKFILGNVKKDSLKKIWNGQAINHKRYQHICNNFIDICSTCMEWSLPEEYLYDYNLYEKDIVYPEA